MIPKSFLTILAVLALAAMACSINIDLPVSGLETGPERTESIDVAYPSGSDAAHLTLEFGAGELNLAPGGGADLVSGTAVYNIDELKPNLDVNDDQVRISTGALDIRGIPNIKNSFRNEWDLSLTDQPLNLQIKAGAYQGNYELGGLALESLEVNDGAANVDVSFSEPNTIEMTSLRYETGASQIELNGLANANFSSMVFNSGAGDYTLDFSGDLQRDMTVNVESGISKVRIIVPEGVSARMIFDGGLSNVDYRGDWERQGDDYMMPGEGPTITIYIDMGAGSVELRN